VEYRIPKHQVPADVAVAGRAPIRVRLFVGDLAENHMGAERPSDVLNGPHPFVPAVDGNGALLLLNVDSIMFVSVESSWEFDPDAPRAEDLASDEAVVSRIELMLDDGSVLRGTVSYLLPESHRRLQDYMNGEQRFMIVRQDAVAHLVNKRRITRVSPL